MPAFIVSFRVDYNATYQERYQSLVDRVHQIATGPVWQETTSVLIFQAGGNAASVCNDIYFSSKLSGLRDQLFVFEVDTGQFSAMGLQDFATLKAALNA